MIVMTTPVGQIGQGVLEQLLDSGEPIRLIIPDPSGLGPRVLARAEVVLGSHEDGAVVTEAFRGADAVFWNLQGQNVGAGGLEVSRMVCGAIKSQGVKRVVAVTGPGDEGVRDARVLDDLFGNTGVSYRTLRTPFVLENLLAQVGTIGSQGMFTLPYAADCPFSTVASADVAGAAARLLLDASWRGPGSGLVVGSDELSSDNMAQVMSEVLERPVHFQQVSAEGAGESHQQGISELGGVSGVYTSPPPTRFRQWCENTLKPAVLEFRAGEVRTAFAHLRADPVLAALIDKRPDYQVDAWRRELPVMDLFGCLLAQIIGQQISLKAARAILGRLSAKFGDRVPSARQTAILDEQALRDVGLTWRKAKTVLDLVARFNDGRLSEQRLRSLPDDQIMAELTQVSGVGPWTVHGALLIYLHRGDVVPVGDILLKNTIKTYYTLDHVPTEQEVTDIAAAWRPYGSLGVNLLFAAAELD